MWIVAIAWMYVAVMMSLTERLPQWRRARRHLHFSVYGALPVTLVMYLLAPLPAAKRAALPKQRAGYAEPSAQPDAGGLPSGDPIATERENLDASEAVHHGPVCTCKTRS